MWIYSQSTGHIWDERGLLVSTGYSGYQKGKNSPKHESEPFLGPIPRGLYVMGDPYKSARIGPHAIPLSSSGHKALERTNFCIHGDSASNPGNASRGCIILSRPVRKLITLSCDKVLRVIE